MSKTVYPSDKVFKGPWLLDKKSLESLDTIIRDIYDRMKGIQTNTNTKQTLQRHSYKSRLDNTADDILDDIILDSYDEYQSKECVVTLYSETGKRLIGSSIKEILKDQALSDISPSKLSIAIKFDEIKFWLQIGSSNIDVPILIRSSKYGDIIVKTKYIPDNVRSDIMYELEKWTDDYKANFLVKLWSKSISFVGIVLFFLTSFLGFVLTRLLIAQNSLINSNGTLNKEIQRLLENGIQNTEVNKALEIQLKYIKASSFNLSQMGLSWNDIFFRVYIIFFCVLFVLTLKPKTIIGVGSNCRHLMRMKTWIYIVCGFIPLSIIIPILLSKI